MNKGTILVADDDADFRECVTLALEALGYAVDACSDGCQALEMVGTKHFDLVLSDIRMPKGDGVDLLTGMLERYPNPPPLVFMTGYTSESFQRLITLGAVDIIKKPFKLEDLENIIARAIATASAKATSPEAVKSV